MQLRKQNSVSSPTDNLMSPTTQKIKAKREHLIKRCVNTLYSIHDLRDES